MAFVSVLELRCVAAMATDGSIILNDGLVFSKVQAKNHIAGHQEGFIVRNPYYLSFH